MLFLIFSSTFWSFRYFRSSLKDSVYFLNLILWSQPLTKAWILRTALVLSSFSLDLLRVPRCTIGTLGSVRQEKGLSLCEAEHTSTKGSSKTWCETMVFWTLKGVIGTFFSTAKFLKTGIDWKISVDWLVETEYRDKLKASSQEFWLSSARESPVFFWAAEPSFLLRNLEGGSDLVSSCLAFRGFFSLAVLVWKLVVGCFLSGFFFGEADSVELGAFSLIRVVWGFLVVWRGLVSFFLAK
mmetsp:Transcript_10507/g.15732  ORF Transcript_10507/g.15732 Transcript_10507/m.15732 type:complete len:240 (+) Transcript_10507:995-1714(+)